MVLERGFCELGFAKLDIDRKKRRGFSEVIYCPGKSKEQLKKIIARFIKDKQDLLLTKLDRKTFAYLKNSFSKLKYNPQGQLGYLAKKAFVRAGAVAVITAGTADIPVAEEAVGTLEVMGNRVTRLYDVGVAGVHRLLQNLEIIKKAKVIIVVAGME
ncbi:MAG: 1-(5-phosphoribosyl)-5-amino-4-imidazole-carboxylate carboxylase, partial [Candidatus Omnitrophica bacterium]|nr:1-(5-phosphoribosyl)-5-amino-4-imidazole-carboxylate carboxylase [Candidatus Omnitrophota bacterium]